MSYVHKMRSVPKKWIGVETHANTTPFRTEGIEVAIEEVHSLANLSDLPAGEGQGYFQTSSTRIRAGE